MIYVVRNEAGSLYREFEESAITNWPKNGQIRFNGRNHDIYTLNECESSDESFGGICNFRSPPELLLF